MNALNPRTCKIIPGRHYGTPKEIWGFRTSPGRGKPAAAAREFLESNADVLGIAPLLPRLQLSRSIESLGAWHLIFQQRHLGMRVHRAYVTVHLDRELRAYLVKNRAVPRDLLPRKAAFQVAEGWACRRALRSVSGAADNARITEVKRVWYPAKRLLHPAFKVRVHRERPRSEWLIYVDGGTGRILSKYDNLAWATWSALVFDPNPVTAAPSWKPLSKKGRPRIPPEEAYRRVALRDLTGRGHRLDGLRVSTRLTPRRVARGDRRLEARSTQPGFDEAMVYFHVDGAIRYLESLGYAGQRAIFGQAIEVNAHGTRDDNSWYSPGGRSLTFGTGGVDDAEDAEVILHELGHAIQDAICPDFGQSAEAAAMGEGFGDYFAASFFAARKPARFRPVVASWDALAVPALRGGDPPCVRRLDEPLTYESFDHSPKADEHENGTIWSATLWETWNALGREVADTIIVESHFQLDGFTTFARGARAILDADRNLYGGRHLARLRRIFRGRGIGPVE